MISATRRWLRRNRNTIAIGAGVIGAGYLAGQYVLGKINEARERMQMDKIAKDNIKRRFEQNQTDCTITVLALLPTLTENVLEALPVEQLTNELQQKRAERLARSSGEGAASESSSFRDGDTASLSSFQTGSYIHASQMAEDGSQPQQRKSKAQLWNELKITSITRAITMMYSLSLLTILTRIQLNLLGRFNYLSSVVSLAQPPPANQSNSISLEDHDDGNTGINFGNDFETNRRYLTFSWFLLHRGYAQIMEKVQAAVEDVFGSLSPNEAITATRLRSLILAVRKQVEGSTEQERYAMRWLPYILPSREEEASVLIESGVIDTPSSSNSTPDPPSNSSPTRLAPVYINTSAGPLRQLLDETADLIDSPTFTRINTLLLNTMFTHLIEQRVIIQSYPQTSQQQSPPSSISSVPPQQSQPLDSAVTVVPAEPKIKLANILAILTRQAHLIGSGNNPPNEYVSAIENEVKELNSFAAVIYVSNLGQGLQDDVTLPAPSANTDENTAARQMNVDESVESTLESAWTKVTGSSSFSSR